MKKYGVYIMGILYVLAGANHFIHEPFYTKMLSGMLPWPVQLVYISGVAEILLGLGLLLPATRSISAIGIVLLLIAVFPANINMALHANNWSSLAPVGLYLRLPIQLLLIWWAYSYFNKPKAETA